MQVARSSQMQRASMQPFQPAAQRPHALPSRAAPRSCQQRQHCTSFAAAAALDVRPRAAATAGASRRAFQASSGPSSRSRSSRLVVRASWGAPVEFSPAKVVSNSPAAEKLHTLLVDVGDLAAGYTKGGQFMQIKVGDGKPGFFAISSPPDPNNQGVLEFLIKAQGEAAEALAALGAGAEVAVSPVMGKGFPVDKIPADNHPTVLLFATGSGISPIKALIESGDLQADKRADVRLYYGTRDAAHTAFADRIAAWEASGVKVIQVFSDADGGSGKGYIQDVFGGAKGLEGADKAGVGAVLCGHKDMCNTIKELLAVEGVDGDKVLLNF